MALTPVDYDVETGPDGQQWLSQPDGSRPGFVFEPVENLTVTSKTSHSMAWAWSYEDLGHTAFEVELHVPGVWNVWTRAALLDPDARSFEVPGGLPDDNEVGMRIRATDEEDPA